jgi:hypothetical protein
VSRWYNSDLDDIGDASIAITHWRRAVSLQASRLAEPKADNLIDIEFAVVSVINLLRASKMLERHGVPYVAEYLDQFHSKYPAIRALRNAVEHFDEHLRGAGREAKEEAWFILGLKWRGGDIYVRAPIGVQTDCLNVSQLLRDVERVTKAILAERDSLSYKMWLLSRYLSGELQQRPRRAAE